MKYDGGDVEGFCTQQRWVAGAACMLQPAAVIWVTLVPQGHHVTWNPTSLVLQ
jgi:hypothetical protein